VRRIPRFTYPSIDLSTEVMDEYVRYMVLTLKSQPQLP
jgi:hypothetical protein